MKRLMAVPVLLMLAGATLAQDPPAKPPDAPTTKEAVKAAAGPDLGEAATGEVIYMRYCAACHGKSLKGDGPVASGLVKKPIDLTQLAKKNGTFPFDKVSAAIDGRQTTRMHGNPDMPVWGEIFELTKGTDAPSAESAVTRITHYVWSKQEKASAEASR
jgi:mono/diheme cytochrome c family protein